MPSPHHHIITWCHLSSSHHISITPIIHGIIWSRRHVIIAWYHQYTTSTSHHTDEYCRCHHWLWVTLLQSDRASLSWLRCSSSEFEFTLCKHIVNIMQVNSLPTMSSPPIASVFYRWPFFCRDDGKLLLKSLLNIHVEWLWPRSDVWGRGVWSMLVLFWLL